MRHITTERHTITYLTDEEGIIAAAPAIQKRMASLGYDLSFFCSGGMLFFSIPLDCKNWEKSERRLIVEEALRLMSESIAEAGRGQLQMR